VPCGAADGAGAARADGDLAWRPLATEDGSWTLVHPAHGEACHSRAGAWLEARERYAVPCRLAERARGLAGRRALCLLDVGTGPGWNVAAALAAVAGTGTDVAIDTLESEPSVIRAGELLPDGPAGAEPWWGAARAALGTALRAGGAAALGGGPGGGIALHVGDARETLCGLPTEPRYDAVFLDPFSPGVDEVLFGAEFLLEVARRMRPQAILSTFTSAFRVRRALAEAGLAVGRGPAVGRKRSGTLASHAADLPPLRPAVAARLARSTRFTWGGSAPTPPLA
jgi:hypothetical protein